jgi:lambda family phage tail tape measure protein
VYEYEQALDRLGVAQRHQERFEQLDQWMEEATDKWGNFQDVAVRALDGVSASLADMLTGGKVNFKEFARSVLADLLRVIIRMQLARALGAFGNYFAGGGDMAQGYSSTATPGAGRFGLGGIFSMGKVVKMAAGDIVNAPTMAPMANRRMALLGEAGPEAVMPLTRDSRGKLGVKAEAPASQVVNKIVNVFDEAEIAAVMETSQGEQAILNVIRRNQLL